MLALALLPLAVSGMRSPTLAASSLLASKTPAIDGVLALRGGGALGPLDVEMLANIQLIAHLLYSVELNVRTLTNPSRKYFNSVDSPWLTLFGSLHGFMTAALGYAMLKGGMGAAPVSQIITAWYTLTVAVLLYQTQVSKSCKTNQPLYIVGTLAALGLYVNFV
mmetsp:Transcript_21887/g.56300  ORF Transcript_21887/g.56300 Transcript_21887/m.56300 type:complete len:164 (-) Transcript_21887:484-975(-)